MNLTTYAANAILDGTPMPSALYLAGFVGDPGPDADTNPAAETRRIGFPRAAAVAGVAEQTTGGSIANAAATEIWTHVALFDASSGGNPWWVGELPSAISVTATETFRLSAGVLTLSLEIWS